MEYKRRYGRMPPKGFDAWYALRTRHTSLKLNNVAMGCRYKFATENDFILIDEVCVTNSALRS